MISVKSNYLLGGFALLSAVELYGEWSSQQTIIYATKPLLMPVLALWLILQTREYVGLLKREVLGALTFSTLGDIFLMFSKEAPLFFLLGVGAFLLAQLSYIGGFFNLTGLRHGLLRRQAWWAAPVLIYLALFIGWLWPQAPEGMRMPVAIYGTALSAMVLSVLNTYTAIARPHFFRLLTGALLFLLSDSLIAVAKFSGTFPGDRLLIMVTYLVAQFLLASGVLAVIRFRLSHHGHSR